MGKKSSSAVSASGSMERNWQAESDCDALIRAEEIEKDPARYKAAKAVAKKRLDALGDVVNDKDAAPAGKKGK